jgi:microcystin-dependent protein
MAWNTPEDWSYKEAPGSTKMNEQIRDNLSYLKLSLPAGVMMDYAGASAPDQWLLCDGAEVSRTTYAALFSSIGVIFGAGDGSSTFNVPDCRGRVTVGAGQGTDLTNRSLAATFGTETHTLTTPEIPAHAHTISASNSNSTNANRYQRGGSESGTDTVNNTGGGEAHTNTQPSLVVTKIIKF